MIKINMVISLFMFIVGICVFRSEGSATLTVPTAGNCGDDTVLTCHVTSSIGYAGWIGLNRSLLTNGIVDRQEDINKYTETRGTTSFTLTIHNTDISDQGEYRCTNEFDQSQLVRVSVECKASSAVHSVTNGKKVTITVNRLYPSSPTFSVSFKKETTVVNISGSRTCTSSTRYPGYYRCVWSSSNSLADGSYTYGIVVTTLTQADPVTGSFKIVSPPPPVIADTVTLKNSHMAVYGNEGQSLTIQCTSTGGYPIPTVVWYKDSVSSSNQLGSTSTGTLQSDGTYTVTLQHTLKPTLADDKKTLICESYYPQADSVFRGSNSASVILYLQCIQHACSQTTTTLQHKNGDDVTLPCSFLGTYTFPEWRGPPSLLIYTIQDDSSINPAAPAASRLAYASNNQDLIIINVRVNDSGEYKCMYTGLGDHTISLAITEAGDPCLLNPCVNGTCFSHGSMFLCKCSQGFTGKLCEKAVDPCQPNPCVHGTCFSHGSLFLCQCSPGYTGKTCQECDDPCRNKPCVHGSCFSHRTSFICQCPGGYTGKLCEKTDVKDPMLVG